MLSIWLCISVDGAKLRPACNCKLPASRSGSGLWPTSMCKRLQAASYNIEPLPLASEKVTSRRTCADLPSTQQGGSFYALCSRAAATQAASAQHLRHNCGTSARNACTIQTGECFKLMPPDEPCKYCPNTKARIDVHATRTRRNHMAHPANGPIVPETSIMGNNLGRFEVPQEGQGNLGQRNIQC